MTSFCHTDKFKAVTSPLTGNIVYVNLDPARFLILPEVHWDHDRLRANLDEIAKSPGWNHRGARSQIFFDTIAPLLTSPGHETLIRTIDALMDARDKWGLKCGRGANNVRAAAKPWWLVDKARFIELLIAFWQAEALALPSLHHGKLSEFEKSSWRLGLSSWHEDLREHMRVSVASKKYANTCLTLLDQLLIALCPVRALGDVVSEALNLLPRPERLPSTFLSTLSRVQKTFYGDAAPSADEYWPELSLQDDVNFTWVTRADPQLAEWAALASEWLARQMQGLSGKNEAIRRFLQALVKRPNLPRKPKSLLSLPKEIVLDLGLDYLAYERFNLIADFLDWVIEARFSDVRPDGRRIAYDGTRNPLERRRKQYKLAESVRNVMPPWILQMMVERLTDNDWAWAQSAFGNPTSASKGDWFPKANPTTGEITWTWSPVRAVCLYAKLTFASRTGQTRHLDSGEADSKTAVFDPAAPEGRQWRMVDNACRVPSQLLPTKLTRAEQRQRDHILRGAVQVGEGDQRNYLKLRFATNKTADQGKDSWNRGYTAPWMPEELARALIWLREWQRENNPVSTTTAWSDVREFRTGDAAKHPDVLRGMESTFLFRDPTEPDRSDHPISDGKVNFLYRALCVEVERMCAVLGNIAPDGQPIRLIASYNAQGEPSGLVYPLHALRVSIITHYIEDGGISPEIMMKIVGHATVVMTLYYLKHTGEYVADMMERGSKEVREKSRRSWIAEARKGDLDVLRQMAFGTSETAFTSFRHAPPGSLVSMNVGVCPTGCTRCHEGGPPLQRMKGQPIYAPVAGGQSNCAGCRFLITGEPWLDGIAAEFNTRSLDLSIKNRHLDKLDQELLPLDDERKACLRESRPFDRDGGWHALMNEKQEIEASQEQLHLEMANLMVLKTQVQALSMARLKTGEARIALVVGDVRSVESALEKSTEYDLVDRICQSVDVFPSLAARGSSVVTATLFRARAWDRILKSYGLEPKMFDLDPDLARHVGNRMSQWLEMKIGRPNTLKLMDGSTSLYEICARSGLLAENFLRELQREIDQVPLRLGPGQLRLVADNSTKPTAE